MDKQLFKSVMEPVETWLETWPQARPGEFLESALDIKPRRTATFAPTLDDLAAIDQAIPAAERGKMATDAKSKRSL